jgi:membrane protein YdbS with pleckstrin-like domain
VAISRRLLNEGEDVVFSTRTHVKALLVPAIVLLLVAGLGGYLSSLTDGSKPWLIAIWVVAAVLLLTLTVWPFLQWLGATYTVTNRRLITRAGVLTRRGHDIPLNRISDVSYERGILDRMLGCGTLIISDASEQGRVELKDVPKVERLQLVMSEQLSQGVNRADDGA